MKLALSGGGFRATIFHLGVIRYLRETRKIKEITEIYSVSGGSILAAHLLKHWDDFSGENEERFVAASSAIVKYVQGNVRKRIITKWLTMLIALLGLILIPPSQFLYWYGHSLWCYLIAASWLILTAFVAYRIWSKNPVVMFLKKDYERFYGDSMLSSFVKTPSLKILSTNMTIGSIAIFDSEGLILNAEKASDTRIKNDKIKVALAVTASSAFPPLFSPVPIDPGSFDSDSDKLTFANYLTDGGVFDNLGVDAIELITQFPKDVTLVSDAERRFDYSVNAFYGFLPSRAMRASDIQMSHMSSIREKLLSNAVLVRLKDDIPNKSIGIGEKPLLGSSLERGTRNLRTDLDNYLPHEIQLLYLKGYGAARAAYEKKYNAISNITYANNGIPTSATPPLWLPITGETPGLVPKDVEQILKQGSAPRYFKIGWLFYALLALVLLTSWPIFGHVLDLYRSWQAAPTAVSANILRLNEALDDETTKEHQDWILNRFYKFQTDNSCVKVLDTVVIVDEIGTYTYGRNYKAFTIKLVSKPSNYVQILDLEANLLFESRGLLVPLTVTNLGGSAEIDIPNGNYNDKLLILVRLCDKRQGSDFDERLARDFLTITIKE